MATALDIANAALQKAGRNPVVSLDYSSEHPTPEGRLAVFLMCAFRRVASSRLWPETTETVKLKQGRKSKYGQFVFSLPSNYWEVLEVEGLAPGEWKVRTPGQLIASISDVTVKYARDISSVYDIDGLLSDEFADTLIEEFAKFIETRLDENFTIVH